MKAIFTRSFGSFRKGVEYDLPEGRYKLFVERMRIAHKVEEPVKKVIKEDKEAKPVGRPKKVYETKVMLADSDTEE